MGHTQGQNSGYSGRTGYCEGHPNHLNRSDTKFECDYFIVAHGADLTKAIIFDNLGKTARVDMQPAENEDDFNSMVAQSSHLFGEVTRVSLEVEWRVFWVARPNVQVI